jgi:hypothetical protein
MKDHKLTLTEVQELKDFPSGSAITYFAGYLYVAGDDATEILVLDTGFREVERIRLFEGKSGVRIPKPVKADIESSAVMNVDGRSEIWLFGSGSVSPHRDSVFALNPYRKTVSPIKFDRFYKELKAIRGAEPNIEAATAAGNDLFLATRGNSTNPDNFLLTVSPDNGAILRRSRIRMAEENLGISGMDYDEKEDRLLITFSSEETASSYDDGKIGNSFLAITGNARSALEKEDFAITTLINLAAISPELNNQKVEGITYLAERNELILVSDDDQGGTKAFRIQLK